ncbi:MAG: indole-3-glycerol phosphate synthase TrpC [Legionellaceae bacterium]|nr:indole-3-glycerol phosphate synthase TrpC [Legionellaceae bacterium]
MNSILHKIAQHKRAEISQAQTHSNMNADSLKHSPATRDFIAALRTKKPAIIAEIKKASPSQGIIREDFDVAEIARIYTEHGAACLSVLTDQHFFQGDNRYLALAKAHSPLPVLRKDFIIDSWQIKESRLLGADCILLIVALLDDQQLTDYCQEAQAFGMAVLVESHTQAEFERALRLPTPLMGVNNRNLHDFTTRLQTSIELARMLPDDKLLIAESGIHHPGDISLLQQADIHHFLIGESLMRKDDIGATLGAFLQA